MLRGGRGGGAKILYVRVRSGGSKKIDEVKGDGVKSGCRTKGLIA